MNGQTQAGQSQMTGLKEGKLRWAVVALGLGLFMCLLDATIVNISIPAMMKDFDADVSRISWVLDAYLITLAVLVLTVGRLADQFGRKRVYNFGIVIFALGSLLCAVSWDVNWLIGFRVLQAVGGAILIPVTMAMITAMFPAEKRGLALGVWAAIGITAAAVGPSLGGLFVEYLSWPWIFYVNLPIAALALVLSKISLAETKDPQASKRMDFPGIIAFSISAFSLVFAVIQGESWGWGSPEIIALFILAALFLIVFVMVEKWKSEPMLDLALLRSMTLANAGTGQFLVAFGMGAAIFLLTLFLQNVIGYSALKAAVAITPIPATTLVFSPLGGKLCDKLGSRIPAIFGMMALGVGIFLLSQLEVTSKWGDVAWRALIVGAGIGLTNPAMAVAAMGATPKGKEGVGSGFLNMSRMMGMAIGVAICVALLSSFTSSNVKDAGIEANAVITEDSQIPADLKETITAKLRDSAEHVGSGSIPDIVAIATAQGAPETALPHLAEVQEDIRTIFRSHIADAFGNVFVIVAIVSGAGVLFALLLRRAERCGAPESGLGGGV